MIRLDAAFLVLAVLLATGLLGWAVALVRHNVNLVDSLWSLFFLVAVVVYAAAIQDPGPRAVLLSLLVGLWALRLSLHLSLRNWGQPEDRRYQAIRANNSPGFPWKSLFIVFWLQAGLAWLIAFPLFAAVASPAPWNGLDSVGVGLMVFGLVWEAVADHQLHRFRMSGANQGRVLDRGLWRYSRHPNYFGEACVWWGFGLMAAAAGAAWALFSPVLMTLLLLKVSGVALMERDIGKRRPEYEDYVRRTSAFLPWPPKEASS